jgi:CPA1 family monovalent cation:H+ antiporter
MIVTIQLLILLLIVIAAVAVIADRLRIPAVILLVITGVVLALVPGLPELQLNPDVVLLLILPPVIYSSAVAMSWSEFRFNLRPISLLAIGCVVFTTVAVAAAAHWLLHLSWPVGFLLGAIVSPPDAVAPLSIARRMGLPHRIVVILEGEGLANDATALILYRFAVAAVISGRLFSLPSAVGTFAAIVLGEFGWGIAIGWLMLRLRRWVQNPRIEILLSLLTPFLAYWPPERLGGSGVVATVTAGLYISWNGLRLISPATRLQGIFFWDFLNYLIEGLVFLLTGLQARALLTSIKSSSVAALVAAGAVVSLVVVVTRFAWMYPATYLPRQLFPAIARRDPAPPWQWPFVLAFTGVRGIVSLAAALAIPLVMKNGAPFPERDLILFVTFMVVLVTLVGQGLTLPALIRGLGLTNAGRREHREERAQEFKARRLAIGAVLERILRLKANDELPAGVITRLRAINQDRLDQIARRGRLDDSDGASGLQVEDDLERMMISAEREFINDLYSRGELKDDARRRIERELDLRDTALSSVREEDDSG